MIAKMKTGIDYISTLKSIRLGLVDKYKEAFLLSGQLGLEIEALDQIIQASQEGGKIMSVVKDMYGLTVEWCDKCGKYTLFENDVCMGVHDDATGTV